MVSSKRKMGHGDAAAKFCETILWDIILMNNDEQLSCTELLHDLRVHCGEMFKDIKSIHASIMVELYREDNFDSFVQYITQYEEYVKQKISKESTMYFTKGNKLATLAQAKIDQLISIIQTAMDETITSPSVEENFMETFFSKIDNLKISYNETLYI